MTSGVDISYSTDNGGNWWPVTTVPQASLVEAPGVNTIPWDVPAESSTQCLIRISSVEAGIVNISEDNFTIRERIHVDSPVGTDVWKVGDPATITWTLDAPAGSIPEPRNLLGELLGFLHRMSGRTVRPARMADCRMREWFE